MLGCLTILSIQENQRAVQNCKSDYLSKNKSVAKIRNYLGKFLLRYCGNGLEGNSVTVIPWKVCNNNNNEFSSGRNVLVGLTNCITVYYLVEKNISS